MIDVAVPPERDAIDAALDLFVQKVERRIIAKHNYDVAPHGRALDHAVHALELANQDLRNAVTNYHNALRDSIEQLLVARPCTLRELLGDAFNALGETDRHARVIEENTPRVPS